MRTSSKGQIQTNFVSSYPEQRLWWCVLLIVKQVWNNILTDIFDYVLKYWMFVVTLLTLKCILLCIHVSSKTVNDKLYFIYVFKTSTWLLWQVNKYYLKIVVWYMLYEVQFAFGTVSIWFCPLWFDLMSHSPHVSGTKHFILQFCMCGYCSSPWSLSPVVRFLH